jgi:hypothetical protein
LAGSDEVAIDFVHGVTDAGMVDVSITGQDTPIQIGPFSFGQSGNPIPIQAGETEICITDHATGAVLARCRKDLNPFAGAVLPVLFSGFLDPFANQNGPSLAVSAIAPGGSVVFERPAAPAGFALWQNYPNPFNLTTIIAYDLPRSEHVALSIFDVYGREVARLVDRPQVGDRHQVIFDSRRLSSGVYFCRMTAGSFTATRKMIVLHQSLPGS